MVESVRMLTETDSPLLHIVESDAVKPRRPRNLLYTTPEFRDYMYRGRFPSLRSAVKSLEQVSGPGRRYSNTKEAFRIRYMLALIGIRPEFLQPLPGKSR